MMDNIREKMVELLNEADDQCAKMACRKCGYVENPVHCKSFRFADYLLANGVTVQEWIPVSDRLPNVFEGVLAYCHKHRNTYLLYLNARGEWHFFDKTVAGALLDEAVTHWMPLPTPPKEEG